jgi:DNA topoisomerase-1
MAGAEAAGLNYVDRFDPGIRREVGKDGFVYKSPDGKRIGDEETLKRIRALVLPPAWEDVWICADPEGHIQATGRDKRGRLQYRYHGDWRKSRDADKYDRMLAFGRALPRLRRQIEADLSRRGLPREKVLAAVVRLLELTLIRVGNDAYAKENKSYGLTTLRKRHVDLKGSGAVFQFKGKSGVKHQTGFRDARLARIVRACQDLRGQRLFQYVGEDGAVHGVTSSDVNAYIHAAMGEGFSAKDFRTWMGSLAASAYLREAGAPASAHAAKAMVTQCVKAVSQVLGNTPAVCRACYIHPRVLEAYAEGGLKKLRTGADPERALLKLLAAKTSPGATAA